MKNTSKTTGVWVRGLAFVTVLSLCACSALQIDVDVYKGPMANHEDIQLQQYAALATSAKLIIVALRNSYIWDDQSYASYSLHTKEYDRKCLTTYEGDQNSYIGCPFQLDIAHFLNSILELYEDRESTRLKDESAGKTPELKALIDKIKAYKNQPVRKNSSTADGDGVRDEFGIDRLTKAFIDATNTSNQYPNEKNREEARKTKERLNESLIIFAEKVLFTVNNHDLANGNNTNSGFAKKFAVLQSLGNTLIVNADDLRKRAAHDQRLKDRKDSELAAAKLAFAPGAQNAFDNLIGGLEAAIKQKENKEASLNSIIAVFETKGITEASITKSKGTLTDNAHDVQQSLDAYRTAFGDYDLKIEGIISDVSLVADDQSAIASLFKQTGSNVTIGTVLTKLKAWFDASKITPQGTLPPPVPEYARRANAKFYFDKLPVANLNIADDTEINVFKKLGQTLLTGLNEDKRKLVSLKEAIDTNQQELDKFAKEKSELIEVRKIKCNLISVLDTIQSIKKEVLQQAETAKVVDLSGLRHLLLLELQKHAGNGAASPADIAKLQAASRMLTEMAIPKSFQLVGGTGVKTQRDVLDDVIAQLQQQRLQAATIPDNDKVLTSLNKALELAYEQRGGLAYLRPASAYLRSAYSNTSVQDGNTSCTNLLNPITLHCNGYDDASRDTKLEIDKQFWQTINTVKVRGGGATDFAIVKDDVGNWYVKGFSSDPESIIKSAQGLALFNMGGKINVNLLGQLEDRRALAKLPIDSPDRATLQAKLDAKQAGSGANTTALGKILDKYRKEYVGSTTTDVDGLIGKLNQLPTDITAAWQGINFGEAKDKDASLATLATLLGTPAELTTAQKVLTDAKAYLAKAAAPATQASSASATVSEAANISASNAIVNSLREVRNMRIRLVREIKQNDALIVTRRNEYDAAKKNLNDKIVDADDKKKIRGDADIQVKIEQARFDIMPAPKDRTALDMVSTALDSAQKNLDSANNEVDKSRTAAKAAEDAFTLAQTNRLAAARKVSILADSLIETTTANRLDAVKSYETAIGFVGETAGAQ